MGTWRPRRELAVKLLRFGAPAGTELFVNVFAFNVFVLLMQSYGPAVATAVTITFNWDLVAFIPMLGVGSAVTALAGQRIGAGDVRGARRVARLGLRVGWSYAGLMVILFVVGAPSLVSVFSTGRSGRRRGSSPRTDAPSPRGTLSLADATQVVFSGALRGAGDTRWVMIEQVHELNQ